MTTKAIKIILAWIALGILNVISARFINGNDPSLGGLWWVMTDVGALVVFIGYIFSLFF